MSVINTQKALADAVFHLLCALRNPQEIRNHIHFVIELLTATDSAIAEAARDEAMADQAKTLLP